MLILQRKSHHRMLPWPGYSENWIDSPQGPMLPVIMPLLYSLLCMILMTSVLGFLYCGRLYQIGSFAPVSMWNSNLYMGLLSPLMGKTPQCWYTSFRISGWRWDGHSSQSRFMPALVNILGRTVLRPLGWEVAFAPAFLRWFSHGLQTGQPVVGTKSRRYSGASCILVGGGQYIFVAGWCWLGYLFSFSLLCPWRAWHTVLAISWSLFPHLGALPPGLYVGLFPYILPPLSWLRPVSSGGLPGCWACLSLHPMMSNLNCSSPPLLPCVSADGSTLSWKACRGGCGSD